MPIDFSKLDRDRLSYLINVPNRNRTLLLDKTSQYDKGFIIPEGEPEDVYSAYYENLAQQQPWYDKAANSIAKGVGLAGTTFIDTFAGTAAGLINMAAQGGKVLLNPEDLDNWQATKQIFNAFVNNPVSNALNDFNEYMESDVLVNYRTKREMDNAWYENAIGLSGFGAAVNFWGDDILKNAGFMAGAMGAGKGIASLGAKLTRLEAGRKEFQTIRKAAEKAMGGVDLSNKSTSELLNIIKNSPEMYKPASAEIMKDFASAAISTRRKEFGIQAAASTLGAFGEARIEAIGNASNYKKERERQLLQDYQSGSLSEEEYKDSLTRLDEEVMNYQNSSFIANSLLLSGSNYVGLRNAYLRPYDYAIKNRVGETVKIVDGVEKGLYKYVSPTKMEIAGKSALSALRESQEEQLQFVIDKTVDSYVRTNKNGESIKGLAESLAEGFAQAYGSDEGWQNAFAGAIFGIIGLPGVGGGMFSEYKDISKRAKEEKNAIDTLNRLIKENKLEDKSQPLLKAINRDKNLEAKSNKAIDNSDQYTYEETKDQKFFNMANAFIEAGKFQDLIDLFEEESELSVDELRKKYSYEKIKDDPNSRVSYFENRSDDEVKDYIRQKTSNAINEVKKLRDLKDNLSTLYRNELIKVKNKEGEDMEIKVKDFLTEQFYMGEARDKRLLNLKNQILNDVGEYIPDDLRVELANDQDFGEFFNEDDSLNAYKLIKFIDKKIERKFGKEKVEDIKKASKEIKDALEREDKTFDKLIDILNNYKSKTAKYKKDKEGKYKKTEEGKFIPNKYTEIRFAIIKDYIKLRAEKAMSNFYLAQLSNNDFSKLIQELKKAEKEVAEEVAKNAQKNVDDDDKYNELVEKARQAGYVTKSDIVYFKYNGELHKATREGDKRISRNVFTDTPIYAGKKNAQGEIVNDYEVDIFDRNFLIENYGKIEFVSVQDANDILKANELKENIQALNNAVNEQMSTIKNSIDNITLEIQNWKKQKEEITTEIDILKEDIKSTAYNKNYTEKRKQWKKQLKNLQNNLNEIDNKIDSLNNLQQELNNQSEGLDLLKENINKSKTIVNFAEITNTFSDILYNEVTSGLDGEIVETMDSLFNVILELREEKKYVEKVINQLEELLLASDTTIKSHFVIMDATFRNKWVNEVGLNYLLNNNGKSTREDFIKNFPTIKRKLRQYSERVGITLKEAFDQFDNELNELKKLEKRYQDQYELENLLLTNKKDLEALDKSLDELYAKYDKTLKNDVLFKKYNALINNLEVLSLSYNRAITKIKSSKKLQESIYGDYSDPEDEDSTNNIINIDENILSSQIFYTTGKDANNKVVNGKYVDILNEEGLPELNSNPAARAFVNFANRYFGDMNNHKESSKYALQVFKYNPETAPQSVKDQIGDKTTDADYYVMLVSRETGEFIYANNKGEISNSKEGYPLFRFIPKSDNLLNEEKGSKINEEALKQFIESKNFYIKTADGKYYIKNNTTKEEEVYEDRESYIKALIKKANKYHTEFIQNIDKQLTEGKKVYLGIKGINQGIPVTKTNKETNKKERTNLLQVLSKTDRNVKISDKGNLTGAEIMTFVSSVLELPNGKKITGKPGSSILYISKTREIVPIATSYLNNDDVAVLLHLIAEAKEKIFLTDIKMDLPKGNYVILGGKKETKIPLFGRGAQYSIINALTYWGRARKNSIKDIYIDKGRVYFGNNYMNIDDVLNFSKNQDLIRFLQNKKYNLHNANLISNSNYFHPILKDGKLTFQKYRSYAEYLFENNVIYSTIANSNQNNYNENLLYLNRNFIFETTNTGDPVIINTLNNKPTTNTPTPNPVQKQDVTTTTSGNYKTLDQITPSNSDEYNFESLENKYIKHQLGDNWSIIKINSDGLLELIKSTSEKSKDAINNMNIKYLLPLTNKDERITFIISNFVNNGNLFLVEPMNEVDAEDPAKVEEEKQKCETGVSSTTSTTASITPITNTKSLRNQNSQTEKPTENNNNPDADL